tara:strand:+ start:237 stop:839 length:603 start_codon:yes stop_codon:yes gene_type:complete
MDNKNNDFKIGKIIAQIKELEDELLDELKHKEEEFFYKIKNAKVRFQQEVIKEGRAGLTGSIKYLSSFPILAILTIPFIWIMIIPTLFIDMSVTLYQTICFPIYKIPTVKRKDYIILDRKNLFYLDKVEKINCFYCEYFNGVLAYVREVGARTEQFWCPIKHSIPPKDKHSRYDNFFDYGDYTTYKKELQKRRENFEDLQ